MTTLTVQTPLHADDVWQIVADVWNSMLGLTAVRADHAFDLDGVVAASVQVHGQRPGLVTLTLPRRTAVELTRVMLQLDATDDVSDEDVADAVGEVVNVVGGNVKSLLAGGATLGLPQVAAQWVPPQAELLCRTGVEWPGHAARVGVWRLPAEAGDELDGGDAR